MQTKLLIEGIRKLVPGQMTTEEQSFLLSTLESVLLLVETQRVQIQELQNEVNRLKGEQGKPDIKGKNQKNILPDISSEKERKKSKLKRGKRRIKFDTSRRVDVTKKIDIEDKSKLPSDIVIKGYAKSHYQNIEIKAELIQLSRAIYYSPSENKTYTAPYPDDYKGGDYSQDLKGHIIMLRSKFGMSTPQIGNFLRMHGVDITNGTISNIYIKTGEELKSESQSIHRIGIEESLYAQTDTTGSRVNGENHHSHVFTNDYFTSYFTTAHKDRQTVLDLLRNQTARIYLLNQSTLQVYQYLRIPKGVQKSLEALLSKNILSQEELKEKIQAILSPEQYERHQSKILEGAYLSAYKAENPLSILIADDAPQYKLCALQVALCWVHIGRNFKKLHPKIEYHQNQLKEFLNEFWQFYHQLKKYRQKPNSLAAKEIGVEFDRIFSIRSSYEHLDQLIAKTKAKKEELLVVLKHPYIPIHNNDSELAVRKEVRYRDISFQTRTKKGTQAKDTFFTIIQTCQKLGLNAYDYILDRLKRKPSSKSLDEILLSRMTEELTLNF